MSHVPFNPRLVKDRSRDYSKVPLYVDSGNILWRFPYRTIKKHYPGLLSLFQQSNSRVLLPNSGTYYNPAIQNVQQLQDQRDAWDILMSTVGRNGSASFRAGVNGQTDYYDVLFDLLDAAVLHFTTGLTKNGLDWEQNSRELLRYVEELSWVVGMNSSWNGGLLAYSPGVLDDLLWLSKQAIQFLGDIDAFLTFDLVESMARMLGNQWYILEALLNSTLGYKARISLKAVAERKWLTDGNFVAQAVYLMI